MTEALKTITEGNVTGCIFYDDDPLHPRKDQDPLGTFISWHRRYDIGDVDGYRLYGAGAGDEVAKRLERDGAVLLPVYMYDHSVQRLSTTSFIGRAHHADWDSGQVGFIYATRAAIREWFGKKRATWQLRQKAREIMQSEINEMDLYVAGENYVVIIEQDGENLETAGMTCHFDEAEKELEESVAHYAGLTSPENIDRLEQRNIQVEAEAQIG